MRLYLAAPLFTLAERRFNLILAHALETWGHTVFLSQRDTPQEFGPDRAARCFRSNLEALTHSEGVVAICEGTPIDDGTAWEIGYACARGIPVYGLRTDSRITRSDERINLMIEQSLTALVGSTEELAGLLPQPSR